MVINEKNLMKCLEACTGSTRQPSLESLQMARSLACEPRFEGGNIWTTPSLTPAELTYTQTVYFAGMNADKMLNLELNIECDCPARKFCVHAIAVERKYHANWEFYFHLFGLSLDAGFGGLHRRAEQVAARMLNDRYEYSEYDATAADTEHYRSGEIGDWYNNESLYADAA